MASTSLPAQTTCDLIESERAITRLINDYGWGCDQRDFDRFYTIWHRDGVWKISYTDAVDPDAPTKVIVGIDEIRKQGPAVLTRYAFTAHWFSNTCIELDGDTATAQTAMSALLRDEDGTTYLAAATYTDECLREDRKWLFTSRDIVMTQKIKIG